MKTEPQILDLKLRHESEPRALRPGRSFPRTDCHFQARHLTGRCGEPAQVQEPSFFRISHGYFADEAHRSFLVDTGVFAALILTAMLPIVNGLQAVAILLHSLRVL